MKNSLRIHKWTHNEFNIFILGVLTHPPFSVYCVNCAMIEDSIVLQVCLFVMLLAFLLIK